MIGTIYDLCDPATGKEGVPVCLDSYPTRREPLRRFAPGAGLFGERMSSGENAGSPGDLPAHLVRSVEPLEAGFIRTSTGPESSGDYLNGLRCQCSEAVFEFRQRDFLIVQSRDQGTRELDFHLTLSQHNYSLTRCRKNA